MRYAIGTEDLVFTATYPDEGTVFDVVCDSGFAFKILMPPWLDDLPDVSRIPKTTYILKWTNHPIHGWTWQIQDVVGRTDVLLHPGNLAGRVAMGYAADSEGCGLPGADVGLFKAGQQVGRHLLTKDQHGVINSDATWLALKVEMDSQDFQLQLK